MFPRSDPFRILCTLGPPHICILTVKALRQSPARPQVRAAACHQHPISNMTKITFWKMEEERTAEKQGARKTKKEQRTRKKEAKNKQETGKQEPKRNKQQERSRRGKGEKQESKKRGKQERNQKGASSKKAGARTGDKKRTRSEI